MQKKLLRAAEGQIAEGRIELNTLMGRDPSATLQVSGTLEGAVPSYTKTDVLALALARNPSLRTRSMQGDIAGLNLRKTRFGRRPDFAIGPSVEYLPNEQTYGISATISLPIWNTSKGEIESATAEQRKALADIEKLRQEIVGAVTQIHSQARRCPRPTSTLLARISRQAQSASRRGGEKLRAERYLAPHLSRRQRTYFDTLANYYEALANVAGRRAELESAVGVPLELEDFNSKQKEEINKLIIRGFAVAHFHSAVGWL